MSAKTGQILILGGGAVVQQCFIPALGALGLLDRTTVVDRRLPAEGFPPDVRAVAADFSEFIGSASRDGFSHCVVALPNVLHHEAVTKALRSGLHVLCEKPLTLHRAECDDLSATADASQRVLAVNMVRRLFHSVQIAADVLARGWLGELRSLEVSHGGAYGWPVSSLAPFQKDNGGVLADMGVHYLDLIGMLVGPLTPVSYQDDFAGGVEAECEFMLRDARHVPVTVTLSRLRPLRNEIVLMGSQGRLTCGVDAFDQCTFESIPGAESAGKAMALRVPGGVESRFSDFFAEQLRRFLVAHYGADNGLVGAQDAAATAALIEWAYTNRRSSHAIPATSAAQLKPGPVYITGATGFIGTHLVERLARDHGAPITAAYHSLRGCARISPYGVDYHATDLFQEEQIREAVKGKRYAFHLAFGDPSDGRSITVDGTKNVVEACIKEGVEAVVILSTMYVLGRPGGMVDETTPNHPIGGAYGATKAAMERWVLDRAATSGRTRLVLLLPTCVYGPWGATYSQMPVSMAREGAFCWIAGGSGLANVVYVENLVDAMILAATREAAHGQRFIVNDGHYSWREFLSPVLGPWLTDVPSPDATEFRALVAPEPGPGLRDVVRSVVRSPQVWDTLARTRLGDRLRPFLKQHAPAVTRMRARAGTPSSAPLPVRTRPPAWLEDVFSPDTTRFTADRARDVLGWVPAVSRPDAVERTVAWLRGQGLYSRDSAT